MSEQSQSTTEQDRLENMMNVSLVLGHGTDDEAALTAVSTKILDRESGTLVLKLADGEMTEYLAELGLEVE